MCPCGDTWQIQVSRRETTFTILFTVAVSAIWLVWIEPDAHPGMAVMFVVLALLLSGVTETIRRHRARRGERENTR